MRKTELALLTLGIVTTVALVVSPFADISAVSALMVTGRTDISSERTERTLAVHSLETVSAPVAEVKPVELPTISVQSHEEPVILDFESEPKEMFTEEVETVSEPVLGADSEPVEELEPGPVEEPSSAYLGTFTVTAYCNCPECCGSYSGGPTASGAYPVEGWTAACNAFSLGTIIEIDGIGTRCIEDRGDSIMDDSWIDLYFDDHDEAQSFGMRYLDVYITE